ncbi:MAG: TadE/TadG family type IV pilus assembly protein [Gemmatimonadales bacterium]
MSHSSAAAGIAARRKKSRLWRFVIGDQRGAAMVEFALVAGVIFIPLVFGIIEFGRLMWSKTTITAAAREGVRFAIVRGASSGAAADTAAIGVYVRGRTALSPLNITSSWTGTKQPGDTVTVQVSYAYTPIVPVISSKTITSSSKQIIAF